MTTQLIGLDRDRSLVESRIAELLARCPPDTTDLSTFRRTQFDLGLADVGQPAGLGGLGLPNVMQPSVDDALERGGATRLDPRVNVLGHGVIAPILRMHGSVGLRQALEPRIFADDDVWCELLSEPGAGSDLASLSTSAQRDGSSWRISGTKIWVMFAQAATRAIVLTATAPDAPRRDRFTMFTVRMNAPGVNVRAMRELTGEETFGAVELTDVQVGDDNRIGEIGAGWQVLRDVLAFERALVSQGRFETEGDSVEEVLAEAAVRTRRGRREELARLWIQARLIPLLTARCTQGANIPATAPKLMTTELAQRVYGLALDQSGASGMLHPGYVADVTGRNQLAIGFLRSVGGTIGGGTSEILRSAIAEGALGLPRE